MTDVVWDPLLHPKDKDGKFTHKYDGVYKALKDITLNSEATGNVAVVPAKPGGQTGVNVGSMLPSAKVSGVYVHAPNGEKVASIDYALKPGEAVYMIHGTQNALLQKHINGMATVLHPTGLDEPTKKGPKGAAESVIGYLQSKGAEVSQTPMDLHDTYSGTHDFQPVEGHPQYHAPKSMLVTSIASMAAAPVGSKLVYTGPGGSQIHYQKLESGKWQRGDGKEYSSLSFTPETSLGQFTLTTFEHEPKHAAPTLKENWAENKIKDNEKASAGLAEWNAKMDAAKQLAADKAKQLAADKAKIEVGGPPKDEPDTGDKVLAGGSKITQEQKLVHSSGAELQLNPGDVVHQHKSVNTSFIIAHPGGGMSKLTSTGKVQKAPENQAALIGSTHSKIHTVNATITVPGTGVQLQVGQSLYSSKGNPNFWAKVEDGKVVELIPKSSSAAGAKAVPKNWQASLDAGKLIPIYLATEKPSASTETAPGVPETVHKEYYAPETEPPEVLVHKEKTYYAPEPKAPKVKAPPKPKVVKAGPLDALKDLPNTATPDGFASGKEMLPGQSMWKVKSYTGGANMLMPYWVVDSGGKVVAGYTDGGTPAPKHWFPKGKWPVAKLLKQDGAEPLAYGGDKAAQELPVGTATPMNQDQYETLVKVGFYGSAPKEWQGKLNQLSAGGDSTATSSPEFAKYLADGLASLQAAKVTHKDVAQKIKARATKTIQVMTAMLRATVLIQRLKDSNHEIDGSDAAERDELNALFGALPWKWYVQDTNNTMNSAFVLKKFAQGAAHLGFDVNDGTPEQYAKYVQSKGVTVTAGMTPEQLKGWTLADLGAPGTQQAYKAKVEASALVKIAGAAVAANAAGVLAKKKALEPDAKEQAAENAVQKKLDSMYAAMKKLHTAYLHKDGSTLQWHGEYGWTLQVPGSGPQAENDLTALALVQSGQWDPAGSPLIGSPAEKIAKSLSFDYPGWETADAGTLQSLGASNSEIMPPTTRKQWLVSFLMGDSLGQYGASALAGPVPDKHAGHPDNVKGKAMRQALADYLASVDWYTSNPDGDGFGDPEKAVTELGLEEAWAQLGTPPSAHMMLSRWAMTHDLKNLPKPSWEGVQPAGSGPLKLVDKPESVTQQAWDITYGAEAGGDELKSFLGTWATADDSDVVTNINQLQISAAQRLKLQGAPENVRRLAAWAGANKYTDNSQELAAEIAAALAARADGGEFTKPDATFWKAPDGTQFALPPGSEVWQHQSNAAHHAIVLEGHQIAWGVNPSGALTMMNGYIISTYTGGTKVAESLAELNPDKAAAEGWKFTEASWDALKAAETDLTPAKGEEGGLPYALKQNLLSSNLLDKYSALPAKVHELPLGVKNFLVQSAFDGNTDALDAALYKIGKGFYTLTPAMDEHPLVDPSKSYAPQVAAGHVTGTAIENNWGNLQMAEFISDHGGDPSEFYYADSKAAWIENMLSQLQEQQPTSPAPKLSAAQHDTSDIQLTKIDKQFGGMHTKQAYADQYGEEWMAKFFASDPNRVARVEAEHYANVIGRLFGFHQPATFVKEMDGQYNYVQHIAPATGSLKGKGPKDLSEDQLAEAMTEHVLDWLLANHDSHPENLLTAPDGKSIIGIDKGQAFKHHHDDKLAANYRPPENPVAVWYDQFYNAVAAGKIDKQLAERVATRVLLKAYQVQQRHDDRFHDLMDAALAQRSPKLYAPQFKNKAGLEAAVMDRKHGLLKDFATLYEGLWKKAGWDWSISTDDFGKKVGAAHVQNGPQFASEVKEASAFGKALMFNSADLEDSHIIMNVMKQKDGKDSLLGFAKIRSEADKLLTAWLKERVEGKLVSAPKAEPEEVSAPGSDLPLISSFHAALVGYAKTLATHASGAGKDGQYNHDTINTAKAQGDKVQAALDAVLAHRLDDPTKPYVGALAALPKFTTLEQQDAWVAAAQQKLLELKAADDSYAQNLPVVTAFPNLVPFKPISYTPSKGLSTKPGEIAEKYESEDGSLQYMKTADGGHYTQAPDGSDKKWQSAQDYLNSTSTGAVKVPLTSLNPDAAPAVGTWTNSNDGAKFVLGDDGLWTQEGTKVKSILTEEELQEFIMSSPDGWSYADGSTLEEKSTDVQVAGKVFKVTHAKAATHAGELNVGTGQLEENKSAGLTEGQSGAEYVVSYGNTEIRYRPWTEPGVTVAQQGGLQLTVKDWDGTHNPIDDVLDTLSLMGVDVTPADQQSLELFYWRQMLGVLEDRKDHKTAKYAKVISDVQAAVAANPKMSDADYLSALKTAWGGALGEKVVEDAKYEPQFTRHYGQDDEGRPYWVRPDLDLATLQKAYGGKPGTHFLTTGGGDDNDPIERAASIIAEGVLIGADERYRLLGKAMWGLSGKGGNIKDQGHGGSSFVFTRQNMAPSVYTGGVTFWVDPRDALRVTNYAFSGDNWGEINNRKQNAPFTEDMFKFGGGGNELQIKNAARISRAVVADAATRSKLLKRLEALGITTVDGVPVENIVILSNQIAAEQPKVWAEAMSELEKADG